MQMLKMIKMMVDRPNSQIYPTKSMSLINSNSSNNRQASDPPSSLESISDSELENADGGLTPLIPAVPYIVMAAGTVSAIDITVKNQQSRIKKTLNDD